MFKRASKITSLLVAAAAVVAVMPGTYANAADRLENKEGKFENAVAYDGKYIYDGYKDDNVTAVYVSDGNDDTEVKDYDDYSGYEVKYGTKYVLAHESNNEDYLVDISTGKVETGATIQDKQEDTANSLKRSLKNTDRYGKNVSLASSDLTLIGKNKFGDVWYKYTAEPGSDAESIADVTTDGKLVGFVSSDGSYIDVCNKANLLVLSGGKTVKIDEFGKDKDGVKAAVSSVDVIAEDNDYIYTITEVKVSGGNTAGAEENQTFVQKISKAKSGDKDGAKLPKSVDSYMLTDAFDGSDDDKAADLITASNVNSDSNKFVVKGGTLYLAEKSGSTKIKMTKFAMKKEKSALANDSSNKLDTYIVKVDDDETHDITSGSDVSVDVDGNVWGLNKGKIFKFDGLSASDVYSCDTSFNKLDVYNSKNLVAWNDNNEVYSALVNGTVASDNNNNNNNNDNNNGNNNNNNNNNNNGNNNAGSNLNNGASTLVPSGWKQEGGYWYFLYSDGSKKTGWYYELGNWYYFYGNGQMATAFIDLGDGAIYYLNPNSDGNQGAMKTGWQFINGYWYYFNPVSDSFGYEGMMQRGWRNIGGAWYFFYYDGTMAANTRIDGYYVNSSGAWVSGR